MICDVSVSENGESTPAMASLEVTSSGNQEEVRFPTSSVVLYVYVGKMYEVTIGDCVGLPHNLVFVFRCEKWVA